MCLTWKAHTIVVASVSKTKTFSNLAPVNRALIKPPIWIKSANDGPWFGYVVSHCQLTKYKRRSFYLQVTVFLVVG